MQWVSVSLAHLYCNFLPVGYTMDTMYFKWIDNPVDVDKGLQLPQFFLVDTLLFDCSRNDTAGLIWTMLCVKWVTARHCTQEELQCCSSSCVQCRVVCYCIFLERASGAALNKKRKRSAFGAFVTVTFWCINVKLCNSFYFFSVFMEAATKKCSSFMGEATRYLVTRLF